MRLTTRTAVLAIALALPLVAALASYLLAADPPPPRVPATVEIGEANPSLPPLTSPPPPPPPKPSTQPPTQVVPPPPPVGDDDGDDGGDDDGGDDRDDGDDDG